MNRQEAIKYLDQHRHLNPCGRKVLEESNEAIDMAIDALNHQTVFEQIKWERDVALQTLEEHGIMCKCKYQGQIDSFCGEQFCECEAYAESIGCEYQEFDYNPDGRINIVICGLIGEKESEVKE